MLDVKTAILLMIPPYSGDRITFFCPSDSLSKTLNLPVSSAKSMCDPTFVASPVHGVLPSMAPEKRVHAVGITPCPIWVYCFTFTPSFSVLPSKSYKTSMPSLPTE